MIGKSFLIFKKEKPSLLISDFKIISNINIRNETKGCLIDITISTKDAEPKQLSLQFSGVTEFKLESNLNNECRIDGFDIVDIRKKGWEFINFEVIDFEDDNLHFYAKDIQVIDSNF